MKRPSVLWSSQIAHKKGRDEIIRAHNSSLNLHETLINRLYVDRRGLIDYEDSPNRNHRTSEIELLERDRLTISQLSLNKIHTGEFLLCRVIGGSFQMLAVVTIVEDTDGQVERLMLYNWTNPPDMVEAENLKHRKFIPIGTIMCVRNPTYTIAADGNAAIRCDDAHDVIVMKNHHPILYGIKWNCGPTHHKNIKLPNPKLQRYQLNSQQIMGTYDDFSDFSSLTATRSHHQSLSPPSSSIKLRSIAPFPCTNLIQTPSSSSCTEKQSQRQHRNKRERTKGQSSKLFKKRNIQAEFLEHPDLSSTIVVCCFIIFLWYVFIA